MSSGAARRISSQDVQAVQNLVERCLQLYMSQKEAAEMLLIQAKVEPGFTELVWQRLQEENQDFFKAYHVQLMVKRQIIIFNELLEKQVELMNKVCRVGVASLPLDGSHYSIHQAPSCFVSEHVMPLSRFGDTHNQASVSTVPQNHWPMVGGSTHYSDDASIHSSQIDVFPNMLVNLNSHMGVDFGINGAVMKSESDCPCNSAFMFGDGGNVPGMCPTIDEVNLSSHANQQSDPPLNLSFLGTDNSSFGFLGQTPCNFNLSDLAGGFPQDSDVLESYPSSSFVATDAVPGLPRHGI